MNNFEEKTKNQGNSKPEASQKENGDMAKEWEELVELDDVQLATVVGGRAAVIGDCSVNSTGGCWRLIEYGWRAGMYQYYRPAWEAKILPVVIPW
jgi:hypothetical protein